MVLFYDMLGRLWEILWGLWAWRTGCVERLGRVVVGAFRTQWRGDPRMGFREGGHRHSTEGELRRSLDTPLTSFLCIPRLLTWSF